MADITRGPNPLFLRDADLREGIEMLYFAYRDFTARPDAILAEHGLGRAHHRVIYFVGRHPGMTVKDLLAILKITKQSLARVLRKVVAKDSSSSGTAGKTDGGASSTSPNGESSSRRNSRPTNVPV